MIFIITYIFSEKRLDTMTLVVYLQWEAAKYDHPHDFVKKLYLHREADEYDSC